MIYESDIITEKEKTCMVSGHRFAGEKYNLDKILDTFNKLIDEGYDTFLVGMAMGFDMYCFACLEHIRLTRKIRLIACVPFLGQNKTYPKELARRYVKMLNGADEVIMLSEKYYDGCYLRRNDFMVERSSALVMFLRRNKGGTFYTYNRAKRNNLKIYQL